MRRKKKRLKLDFNLKSLAIILILTFTATLTSFCLNRDIYESQKNGRKEQLSELSIGDTIKGGIVFYLDASGEHGLICSLKDQLKPSSQQAGFQWWNGKAVETYAHGSGIGSGEKNCQEIRRWQGDCDSCNASEICQDLSLNGYSDWYLPSKYELNLMYKNIGPGNSLGLGNAGGFDRTQYWSSTEHSKESAWCQNFSNGKQDFLSKYFENFVRPIRRF